MEMNDILIDKILETVQDCVFWKDTERRFVGVNKAFLDFYGFESADELIGKTDEDVGWHNDPEPYKQDELRVLAGESTYKVPGKCMVRGEERDIIASKAPIYENGKIVGLIGSFLDVTDPMRRSRKQGDVQVLYSIDFLRRFPYFDNLLDDTGLNDILDPLTGIISRAYILDYAKSLIFNRTSFTFALIDLDNFKYINDTYGHHTGDVVLMDVSKALTEYTGDAGLVGRFGGDELVLISTANTGREDNEVFFGNMYDGHSVFRRNISIGGNNPFITGTMGCAVYPSDAADYDELFNVADKALYRGKSKGRNCYVIYDAAKYKDLVIDEIRKKSVYATVRDLATAFDYSPDIYGKLKGLTGILRQDMLIKDLYYVGGMGQLKSLTTGEVIGSVSDLGTAVTDELYSTNNMEDLKSRCPVTYKTLAENNIESFLAVRIGSGHVTYGYFVCMEKGHLRIWQEDEYAVLFSLSRFIAQFIRNSDIRLD